VLYKEIKNKLKKVIRLTLRVYIYI